MPCLELAIAGQNVLSAHLKIVKIVWQVTDCRELIQVCVAAKSLLAVERMQDLVWDGVPVSGNVIIVIARTELAAHRFVDELIPESLDVVLCPVASYLMEIGSIVAKDARHRA